SRFTVYGPFVDQYTYQIHPITCGDLITAYVVFGLAMCFAILAVFIACQQTQRSRVPLKSLYVWMIWLEIVASLGLALLAFSYLIKVLRPSLYFYLGIVVSQLRVIYQVQILLQIICNRINVILQDQKKGTLLCIGTFVLVSIINVSVGIIWIPACLQISDRRVVFLAVVWIRVNTIWDRTEKVLFFLLDAALNWYFVRVVKRNLIGNGMEKYRPLVRFNQRMILISLLMDLLIIGAMSLHNGFVYAMFHPLAYLVKLNIEMSMANLIMKIVVGT
ncbi:uncharacterized protein CC84DRAFT_1053118, partial [Paraphaeosphaeria sporulosa]